MRRLASIVFVALSLSPSSASAKAPARGGPKTLPPAASSATPSGAPPPRSAALAPDDVLHVLEKGNAAFVSGHPTHPHQDVQRILETAGGQHPMATILSCSDSRVPTELLFDEGIGDLFGVRVAGNVADADELGTIEYGVDHLETPLLVVLGHTKCGAVTAVATGAELHGHIPELVDNIQRAVDRAKAAAPGKPPAEVVGAAIVENVRQSMADVISKSPLVRARLRDGKTKMVGALYHLEDGKVEWLGAHPEEAQLIRTADLAPPAAHEAHAPPSAGSSKPAHDAPHGEHADATHGVEQGSAAPPLPALPASSPIAFALTAAVGCLAGALSSRLASRDR